MIDAVTNARRARKQLAAAINATGAALAQSRACAAAGQWMDATRAAQLADRHAKLATQLAGLDAALRKIATARQCALEAIAAACANAEAKLQPHLTLGPNTDPADMSRNWSSRDPRVQALFRKAMEKQAG